MMKLSDYVARFLARKGIRHAFAIAGGASVHLIDSIAKTPGIDYVCPQHEQAGAMAADGYARITGYPGAAIATSGPGATNMITGVCCAYYDSVPVLYITGQVATFRMKRDSGVRQMGFQETDTVEMYRPITKYAVLVKDPTRIRYELEKAYYIAISGRPGPVLIDLPDDLQRQQVEPEMLEGFTPPVMRPSLRDLEARVRTCLEPLRWARRPVLVLGWGIRLAKAEKAALELIERLGFPVLPTWAMMDFLPSRHHLIVGGFGTHGTRFGNLAIQNADLLLSIGSRLDTHEVGSPYTSFAREAKKIVVDIDQFELAKFSRLGVEVEHLIQSDAGEFLRTLNAALADLETQDLSEWKARIQHWKKQYPVCRPEFSSEESVNPYVLMKILSDEARERDVFFVDTGCALAWMMQGFEVKPGQRLFHDFNNTAMGYALPAAIGASIALSGAPVVCVTGDGSLQMNLQELATVLRHNLPIKIILLNNHGYAMIQQTQEQWLGSHYEASSLEGGLAFPDFGRVAEAYGYKVVRINRNDQLRKGLRETLRSPGPIFCDIDVPEHQRVVPQVKFGRPIEDSEPLLERDEFLENMIVQPMDVSLRRLAPNE